MDIKATKLHKITFGLSLIALFALVVDFGFENTKDQRTAFNAYYILILSLGIVSTITRYIKNKSLLKRKVVIFDSLSTLFSIVILVYHFFIANSEIYRTLFFDDNWVKFAVLLTFIREFSDIRLIYKRTVLNPAQLFIASFMGIILIGSFMLMLPNATHSGISFIDALFTSTSAVCVTGLIVVDTGSYFTVFGQSIIVVLIQIGGLGILTFASYFSYFFRGGSTYENQLAINDFTNSQTLNNVFRTLKYIIGITFGIELISAILIYFSVDSSNFSGVLDQGFFALFHAISAFCNAGFSTLSNSLYEGDFRFNYALQVIVILTFVFGGLGFPIVENLLRYLGYKFKRLIGLKHSFKPWVLNLNSRITLITTFTISAVAVVAIYALEYKNTLAEHTGIGKVVTALFTATTPRTAGFNTIDFSALTLPALMLIFLLMWIGASPSSTGGGVKTSTFAIATLNILSLARGKSKIEVFRREISNISVRRSYAIISLSLIIIGFSIFLLSITDKNLGILDVAFETFSAYSTVGLSLGITSSLSEYGKLIIIFTMFVGRVSMLTVVIALFKKIKQKNYSYPTEEITIN